MDKSDKSLNLVELAKNFKSQKEEEKKEKIKQKAKIETLQNLLEDRKKEVSLLQNQLEKYENIDEKLDTFFVQLKDSYRILTSLESGEVQREKKANDQLRSDYNLLTSKYEKLEADYNLLQHTCTELEKTNLTYKTKIESYQNLEKENQSIQKEYASLQNEQHIMSDTIKDLENNLEMKNNAIESLRSSLEEMKETSHTLETENQKLKSEYLEIQQQLQHAVAKVETLTKNVELMETHKQELRLLAKEKSDLSQSQAKDWELKFFHIQEQCHQLISDKKLLEDKLFVIESDYQELVNFFSKIKKVLGKKLETKDFPQLNKEEELNKPISLAASLEKITDHKKKIRQLDMFSSEGKPSNVLKSELFYLP